MELHYLTAQDIDTDALRDFQRHQQVTQVWRRHAGAWGVENIAYTEDWDEAACREKALALHELAAQGGIIAAGMEQGQIRAFAALDTRCMPGQPVPTMQMVQCQVDARWRGRGLGTRVFAMMLQAAKARGADALYISANSAVEAAAFYRAMGCVEATVPDAAAVAEKPCDIQLIRDVHQPLPLQVSFQREAPKAVQFAVIYAQQAGKTLYCRHRERTTWEFPGGHVESGETPLAAARRELWEETGAKDFDLSPVGYYRVAAGAAETWGLLCRAEVRALGTLPPLEIAEVRACDTVPGPWTYPQIQPRLLRYLTQRDA